MFRRSFLKGVIGGVTSAGLVVAATPREIEAFASAVGDGPVVLDAGRPLGISAIASAQEAISGVHVGQALYNERGDLVACVTKLVTRRDQSFDVTLFDNTSKTYVPGLSRLVIEAEPVGR